MDAAEVKNIEKTPLQEFYAHQCIFITGGTGFVGKALIEKLLRSCFDLKRIYLLLRPKNGQSTAERVEKLFNDPLFDRLKADNPNFLSKIQSVEGSCDLEGLGLSSSDRNLLINDVSIIFHVAASVNFNVKLKVAVATNLQSTLDIIGLCSLMKNLKSFILVSSIFASCELDENFCDCPIKAERLLKIVQNLPDKILDEISPRLIAPWPNSYAFTKSMAENLIETASNNLPVGILRPSIIISTAKEPISGWVDNYFGPNGPAAGVASGLLRTFHVDVTKNANLVPVDLTVNALIASAWDVSVQKSRRNEDSLIYNFVSSVEAPLTWNDVTKLTRGFDYPVSSCIWYPTIHLTKHKILYLIYVLFLHVVPGVIIDAVLFCLGKRPKMLKKYKQAFVLCNTISYFNLREWKFTNKNVQNLWERLDPRDQELFNFSMKNFCWQEYFRHYMKGIRVYLLKDPLETMAKSRNRRKIFYLLHQLIKASIIFLGLLFLYKAFVMVH